MRETDSIIEEIMEYGGEARYIKASEIGTIFIDRTCDNCKFILDRMQDDEIYLVSRDRIHNDFHINGIYHEGDELDSRLPINIKYGAKQKADLTKKIPFLAQSLLEFGEAFEDDEIRQFAEKLTERYPVRL